MSSTQTTRALLNWSAQACKAFQDEWLVESNPDRDGVIFMARFTGPGAETRAREYAAIKNAVPNPEQALEKAEAALVKIEWAYRDGHNEARCPACHETRLERRHADDCKLALALAAFSIPTP